MSDTKPNDIVVLDEKQKQSIALFSDFDAPAIIQDALQKTYKLFTTQVAGITHLEGLYVGQELKMLRDGAKRETDSFAIKLLTENGAHIGYVPQRVNQVFANMMDQGLALKAKIVEIDDSYSFKLIDIDILLNVF